MKRKLQMKNNPLQYLINITKSFPLDIAISIFSEIFATIAALFISMIIGKTLDLALYPRSVDFNGIFKNLIIIAVVTAFGALMRFLSSLYSATISYKIESVIRKRIFEQLNKTTLNHIDTIPHGDIVSRIINDVDAVGEGIFQILTQVFAGFATAFGAILLMGKVNISVMLFVIALTPFLILTSWLLTKFSYKSFRGYANLQGKLLGFSEEMISNQFVVNAFGYQKYALNKFKKINNKMFDYGVKSQFLSSLANPAIRFLSWIIYASVGTLAAYLLISGQNNLTIGSISSLLIYSAQYTRPFTDIMGIITQVQSAIASLNRCIEFNNLISLKTESGGTLSANNLKGQIDIENVFFSYTPKKPVLKNFTLHIKSGAKVALVGATGCGKSTIINLLMRFYKPDSGTIKIDGIPINKFDLEQLRHSYGMILQNTWLYNASIKENISYGNPQASFEEIKNAAKLANAHAFITKLENGYDTILSESGSCISQGQKQLLSIARVMLINPKILLLDEATSNIDARTESKIQNAFNTLMKNKTSIIVAHRLSTIKNADLIVVMDKGSIIEHGTHNELLSKKGFYYNLYNA